MKQYSIIILLVLFFSSCKEHKVDEATSKKLTLSDTMMRMIAVDSVRQCNINDEVALSGAVSFNENSVVKVFPRSSGQVLRAPLSVGDYVHKGQVLAAIRSSEVAGSFSDLSSANADIAIAKRQMENARELYKNGISSEREFTEAKQNYEKALAAHSKIQSTININGGSAASSSGEYVITSPIDGYIVEKKINAGSFIRADAGDNLFTISDLKNVWVYANVYEADIPKIKEGYTVTVQAAAYPGRDFIGKIDMMGQVLDPQSKALKVRVTIDNKDLLLKPEMFAKVIVSNREERTAICIPSSAVINQDGKDYVVTYVRRDSMDVAEVNVMKIVGDKTYLNAGVHPGQLIITKEQLFIFNQLVEE